MNENFEEYMNYFKGLTLKEKQDIVYDQLKNIAEMCNKFCNESGIPDEIITYNNTDNDYIESLIVLINSIQNSVCNFAIGTSEITDKIIEMMPNDN